MSNITPTQDSDKLLVMPRESGEFQATLYFERYGYHLQIAEVYGLVVAQRMALEHNNYKKLVDAVKFAIEYMLTINAADEDSPAIKHLRAALAGEDGK